MPVPVSPQKLEPTTVIKDGDSNAKSQTSFADPSVVAGYQDCLRETLRFLIEEEQLPVEHPVVAGISQHLNSENAHIELENVSQQIAISLNQPKNIDTQRPPEDTDSGLEASDGEEEVGAFKITLMEDDISSDEDEEMDLSISDEEQVEEMEEMLITAKDILDNPVLRKELIRLVFQGCDLVASPQFDAGSKTITNSAL